MGVLGWGLQALERMKMGRWEWGTQGQTEEGDWGIRKGEQARSQKGEGHGESWVTAKRGPGDQGEGGRVEQVKTAGWEG